ncbi:MAG: RNase P subunit [Nitrososphaera sp.]
MKKKSSRARRIAQERVEILVNHARREQDTELAERQAATARKIAMRVRIRIPYEHRQLFCKKCKRLIVPGRTSRVRIGRTRVKAIRITCLRCGHIYRKLVQARQPSGNLR